MFNEKNLKPTASIFCSHSDWMIAYKITKQRIKKYVSKVRVQYN